ncbi:MAG: hypothetical protein KF865_03035 [Bdellovibrionaceae bacterium]|nr:hypothetical protein [Pseudobdellovibrionaceae bacterium]
MGKKNLFQTALIMAFTTQLAQAQETLVATYQCHSDEGEGQVQINDNGIPVVKFIYRNKQSGAQTEVRGAAVVQKTDGTIFCYEVTRNSTKTSYEFNISYLRGSFSPLAVMNLRDNAGLIDSMTCHRVSK